MKRIYIKLKNNNARLAKQTALRDIFENYDSDIRYYGIGEIDVYNPNSNHITLSPKQFFNRYISLEDK